ncbi:hypothetical protein H5410_021031 [Solanum commersonii]|uniref:Uncharacterized protein n=1 Tax=Solanum commersonii TaxID=4109 RepID=A0A9J5ZG00_SOLCO|nr:hypothetical protein H5410_021031 [Solanum commersonii]
MATWWSDREVLKDLHVMTLKVSSRDFSVRSGFDAEVIGLWKGSVIRHGILFETRSLYGGYDGTRVILVRVMGYVASAIDRAYEIVHIIFDRRLKCFAYGRWLTTVQPEGLIALHGY